MKKFIPILILSFAYFFTNAQISMEHSFPYSTTITKTTNSGYKYFAMDVVNNQCLIYDTDYSLWKTINLQIPAGHYLYDVKYVSDNLFDTDAGIELYYTYYFYDTTAFYYTYYSKIINEDGSVILDLPGCYYSEIIKGATGYILLAYIWDFSVYPSTLNTVVYSLPGSPAEVPYSGPENVGIGAAYPIQYQYPL